MRTLIALLTFSWAHQGINIVEYKEGESIETDDQDLIDVSTEEGWATLQELPPLTLDEVKAKLKVLKIGYPKSSSLEQLQALLPKD